MAAILFLCRIWVSAFFLEKPAGTWTKIGIAIAVFSWAVAGNFRNNECEGPSGARWAVGLTNKTPL